MYILYLFGGGKLSSKSSCISASLSQLSLQLLNPLSPLSHLTLHHLLLCPTPSQLHTQQQQTTNNPIHTTYISYKSIYTPHTSYEETILHTTIKHRLPTSIGQELLYTQQTDSCYLSTTPVSFVAYQQLSGKEWQLCWLGSCHPTPHTDWVGLYSVIGHSNTIYPLVPVFCPEISYWHISGHHFYHEKFFYRTII